MNRNCRWLVTATALICAPALMSLPALADANTADHESGPVGRTAVRTDRGKVVEVVDGDTVTVKVKGKSVTVRMLGIDTPDFLDEPECGAERALKSARHLLPAGTRVKLTSDPTQQLRDQYHRQLRYVERGRRDIGRLQVLHGWAKVYVFDDDPFQRARSYQAAQRKAKRADRGIWKLCTN